MVTEGFTLSGATADLATAGQPVTIQADSDADGLGTFTINAGSIVTNGADFTLTAANVALNGTVNAGAGNVLVRHSRPDGTISLGPVSLLGDLTIDTASDVMDGSVTSFDALLLNPGLDGNISLREAILATNNTPGRQTVLFDSSLNGLPIGISITGRGEDGGLTGDFDILGDLILSGRGTSQTLIDGAGLDRVFDIRNGALVIFENLTIRNGMAFGESGGGLRVVNSSAQLNNTVVTLNSAANGNGGGIFATGDLLLRSTSVTSSGAMPARSTAARMATPPRSCAASDAKSPWNAPMGVRAALTMTTGSVVWLLMLAPGYE
jgi:predicted outer membrane repeat protein